MHLQPLLRLVDDDRPWRTATGPATATFDHHHLTASLSTSLSTTCYSSCGPRAQSSASRHPPAGAGSAAHPRGGAGGPGVALQPGNPDEVAALPHPAELEVEDAQEVRAQEVLDVQGVEAGARLLVVGQVVEEVEPEDGEEHHGDRRRGEVPSQDERQDKQEGIVFDLFCPS